MADQEDLYAILGVPPDASADAIRAAFHRVAMQHHPDVVRHLGANEIKAHVAIFRRAAKAFRVLSDSESRAQYDSIQNSGRSIRPLSMRAAPFVRKAKKLISKGKMNEAKLQLQLASGHDPEHPEIESLKGKLK